MRVRSVVLALLLATPLRAQTSTASDVMTRAVRAYRDLEFDTAATLLRRALAPPFVAELDDVQRARALTYLGAAEHYRGQPDSAIAAFSRLVVLAPRQQPDTLIFPPEITQLYEAVRISMTPVAVHLSADTVRAVTHNPPAAPDTPTRSPPLIASEPFPTPKRTADRETTAEPRAVAATGAGLLAIIKTSSDAGAAGGFTGSVRFRRVELEVRYAEGKLRPADPRSAPRDLVEGAVALRFVATPWLSLQLGPHARRYDSSLGAERWVTWQLGTRGDVALAGPAIRGHALLWRAMGLGVNVPPGSGSARGGEVGVTIDLGPRPFWFALAYGIDQAQLRDAVRRETVETLTLTAGIRRR